MFKDARQLDVQRTASSFDQAYRRYAGVAEGWFDGTVNSVDARLGHCARLAHAARSTVARLSVGQAQRYLRVAATLEADREVLAGLRDDLLTGATGREDVLGPPGYRTATAPDFQVPQVPTMPSAVGKTKKLKRTTTGPEDYTSGPEMNKQAANWWDPSWPTPNPHSPVQPQDYHNRQEYLDAVNMNSYLQDSVAKHPEVPSDVAVDEGWRNPNRKDLQTPTGPHPMGNPMIKNRAAALAGADRRWVALESARFVAANSDTLDDCHELATRAHHHAALKTSTFPQQRSAAVCRAFVEEVVDLGRRTYRPPVTRTAAYRDFDDQAIYLC